ncbi:c-type cytochrome [Mesorhizobium neociceri]|uniref:Cytochrome c family protein n=1 Tax=Mesorhizobium neociceri TaxID=1307853 RepID=A0A838B9N5_9HYPH|nr:cytochrome c family protein [Mesorhizobium neociceri]MBA1143428.1 cytochrome c family protein [Mesorhizobium neociceri]
MRHPLSLALILSAAIVSTAAAHGNADHGKTLFSRCAACHAATDQNKVGPGLAGVFGRPAGTAPNFRYSKAMIAYAKPWDEQTLDGFLTAPAKAIPGTSMTIAVSKASDRADIIAYLKSLGSP